MEILLKAVAIGVIGAILTLLLRRTNQEMAAVLAFALCCVIGGLAVNTLSQVMEVVELSQKSMGDLSVYSAPVVKCVGIGICAKLGADLCRDAGQSAVAGTVELCGAFCAMYVSLPLIKTLIRLMGELT